MEVTTPLGRSWSAAAPFVSQLKFARPQIDKNLKQSAIMQRVWIVIVILTGVGAIRCADPPESHNSQPIVSHIPREPVHSTAIGRVGYSKRRHVLEIEFVNGAIYRYLDVPSSVYRDLISAESKARFYDFNIKGKYRSARVQPRIKHKPAN
jgi:hypothetical protein